MSSPLSFIVLKVLAFVFHRTQSPPHLSFLGLKVLCLYFSKTIRVCCLAETINVFCPLHFKDDQSLLSCREYQCLLPFTFPRLLKSVVFCLYISKTIKVCCLVETSMSSAFTYQDYQSLLSCRDFNVFCLYFSKTIKVCCLSSGFRQVHRIAQVV